MTKHTKGTMSPKPLKAEDRSITTSNEISKMSVIDKKIYSVLINLIKNFADFDDGDWWGYDTALGDQEDNIQFAIRRIKQIKRTQIPVSRRYRYYKDIQINRKALARAVWGKNIPPWWSGSTGEWNLMQEAEKAK